MFRTQALIKLCGVDQMRLAWRSICLLLLVSSSIVSGAQSNNRPAADGSEFGRQFLVRYCRECHSGETPAGDFDADALTFDFEESATRERWLDALQQISVGNMPPEEKERPTEADTNRLTEWVHAGATSAELERRKTHGRVPLRRLNRNEYGNTLRDLFEIHVDLKDLFPPSTSTSGFDNDAQAQHVSTYHLENYLAAADRALDAAIANQSRPRTVRQRHDIKDEKTVSPTGSVYRHLDDGVAVFSAAVNANVQVTMWRFMSRYPGRYRFRISAYAYQTDDPVSFHVKAGPMNAAAQQYLIDYFQVPPGDPTVVEFVDQMKARQTIRIVTSGLRARPRDIERIGADKYMGPGMVIQWVDVEGPILDSWPPPGHQRLFGELPQRPDPSDRSRLEVVSEAPIQDATKILRRFTRRAFRRPVSDEELQPFLARVRRKLDEGDSFESAVRVGLRAVLVAPDFLFLRERATQTDAGLRLDDFALASRLSYFLWSSMPDETLLVLAEAGRLSDPATLRAQVDRMLADPKADSLTEHFTGQWLALRAIDDTLPDRLLYPEYDNLLKESMLREVRLFFRELVRDDLSITSFVDSDFLMLNERLARHYGIAGVRGLDFRRVRVPDDSPRGGLLTSAAVMKVTANGTTTSPILRGAWVLDRILGAPPPRPTVDVEAVEPDIRGATTIRDQLARRRDVPSCATCHRQIDPHGFALENFDVIGGWRSNYRSIGEGDPVTVDGRRMRYRRGAGVDASDVLADGRSFDGIEQYKARLLEQPDELARAVTSKLIAYSTGAVPVAADDAAIDDIVARIQGRNYGLRSLIHEIVQSDVFRNK